MTNIISMSGAKLAPDIKRAERAKRRLAAALRNQIYHHGTGAAGLGSLLQPGRDAGSIGETE